MNIKKIIPFFAICVSSGLSAEVLPQITVKNLDTFVPTEVINVWDGVKMQGGITEPLDYSKAKVKPERASVKYAKLSFYKATNAKNGGCAIICPGGGYKTLWTIKGEGTQIAKYFNDRGISAVVLEYRVPDNIDGALMDAQRAIRLVRHNAKKWGIAPDKIAIMGFSAGASLAARVSTNFKNNSYKPVDAIDNISTRPDYTILIYPAYCSQPEKDRRFSKDYKKPSEDYSERYRIADWHKIDSDTPPAFITQTQKDPWFDASIAYYLELNKHKIPAELFLLSEGSHGYKNADVFEILSKILKKKGF